MITNDKEIRELKHDIATEVCRLAWEGKLTEDEREKIVYQVSPGPKPEYRCCVYKERAIVRERIRLACGMNADPADTTRNVVQVIRPACDDCPVSTYSVTDNCRFCLGRACINSCHFGAITKGERRMQIDPNKCRECGLCAKACPYGAIIHLERPCKKICPVDAISWDEYGFCHIDDSQCIHCGHCIHACPFGAIGSRIFLIPVIEAIKTGREVFAMCAPASEGQFGKEIGMASLRNALKKTGFADMVEVGLGGDMTAASEAKEWIEAKKQGKKMTTSCCPAFISMIRHQFPELYEKNKSATVSPMVAVNRYLKAVHPGCVTVFIGPCIAKKGETLNEFIADNADYAITFGEMKSLLESKGVTLEPVEEDYQEASLHGKQFASSGGVAAAVLEAMQEMGEDTSEVRLTSCTGGAECRKALTMLRNGKLEADFIEGMICPGGCVGGPSRQKTETEVFRSRAELLKKADSRRILDNLKQYPMESFSMYRDGHMEQQRMAFPIRSDERGGETAWKTTRR